MARERKASTTTLDLKIEQQKEIRERKANGFVGVGKANDLDVPGAIFGYQSYVRMQESNLLILLEIFEANTQQR